MISESEPWRQLVSCDEQRVAEVLRQWGKVDDKLAKLRQAIKNPSHRGAALRLLLILDGDFSQQVFEELIECASVGHSDIALCRQVIKSMPRRWVLANISAKIDRILNASPLGEEEFRRLAELLDELDDHLLAELVNRALQSANADVREVGQDFETLTDVGGET